jgi:AraC-like DNA-binding protein
MRKRIAAMQVTFTSASKQYSYSDGNLAPKNGAGQAETEVTISDVFGELLFKRNKLTGITVWNHELQASNLLSMTCMYKPAFVGIHATLEGPLQIHSEGVPDVLLQQREYVLGKLHNIIATFTVTASNRTKSLHIHYSSHYFRQLVQYCPSFSLLLGNTHCIAHERPFFINEIMLGIVNEILDNNYPPALKLNYVHVKSVELLMHVTKEIIDASTGVVHTGTHALSNEELQALYGVPQMLEARIDEKITIQQLARKLAMGPMKLTRSFKSIYGLSVHQYVIRLRLHKAYGLLTTTATPIGEIAMTTGFSSTHHLSNAFKKAFGISPLVARKKGRE